MDAEQREKMIEAAARAICVTKGLDPDDLLRDRNGQIVEGGLRGPNWGFHVRGAQAALAIIEPMIRADERERWAAWHNEKAKAFALEGEAADVFAIGHHEHSAAAIRGG